MHPRFSAQGTALRIEIIHNRTALGARPRFPDKGCTEDLQHKEHGTEKSHNARDDAHSPKAPL